MATQLDDLVGMTVEQIMATRNVSSRYAYTLYQRANRPPEVPVERSLKRAILLAVKDGFDTVEKMLPAIHESYGSVDAHNIVHVIWSLQKQRLLRFRENKRTRELTAIRLRPEGQAWLIRDLDEAVSEATDDEAVGFMPSEMAYEVKAAIIAPSYEAWQRDPGPEPEPESFAARWPLLDGLVKRAERVALLRQAAELLERAGDEQRALEILEEASLTPLEEEVVRYIVVSEEP